MIIEPSSSRNNDVFTDIVYIPCIISPNPPASADNEAFIPLHHHEQDLGALLAPLLVFALHGFFDVDERLRVDFAEGGFDPRSHRRLHRLRFRRRRDDDDGNERTSLDRLRVQEKQIRGLE